MAPALLEALQGANAPRLREFFQRTRLFEPQPDGSPSPMVTLMRVTVGTLTAFSRDPPESGALPGALCNERRPPPSRDSNRACEARRILRMFVREGEGLETLRLLDPLTAGVLGWVVGRPPAASVPHYEVATALAASCSRAYCRSGDTLDTLIRLIAFIEPTLGDPRRPQRLLSTLNALLSHPAMTSVLDQAQRVMSEADMVAVGNLLLDNLTALPSNPEKFPLAYHRDLEVKLNDLLTTTIGVRRDDERYRDFRLALDQVIGPHEAAELDAPHGRPPALLYDLLDPAGREPVLGPLQRQTSCLRRSDPDSALLRLVWGLGYAEDLVGLSDVLKALEGLTRQDERLSLLTFVRRTLDMVKADEEGTEAARRLCATAFDTGKPADAALSNAGTVMPVLFDLFEGGAVAEGLCVLDTLLYGCAGGWQPACAGLGPGPAE